MVDADIRLGILLKLIHNAFEGSLNRKIENLDLTLSQAHILMYLKRSEKKEINQRDVESNFQLSNPTVTGILKRLEAKGFILRVPSLQDGRQKQILLTDKSESLYFDMQQHVEKMEQELIKGISEEEIVVLKDILQKILVNLMK